MERLRRLIRTPPAATPPRQPPESQSEAVRLVIEAIIQDNAKSLAELLVLSEIDPAEFAFGRTHRSLLHVAASLGANECLALLAREGSDPNRPDDAGVTAVHLCARNGHQRCLQLLVEAGADLHVVDQEGFTAVHWLACNGRTSLLQYLLSLGEDADIVDRQGQTALHVACQSGHASAAALCMRHGADHEKQDEDGRTALLLSCRFGQQECVQLLLEKQASFTTDKAGLDPFEACVVGGHAECAALLAVTYPKLLHRLVTTAATTSKDEETMLQFMRVVASHGSIVCRAVLLDLANLMETSGHQLLCLSSDYGELSQVLVRLTKLIGAVVESSRASAARTKDEVAVLNLIVAESLERLESVWQSLEEWLSLLLPEAESLLLQQGHVAVRPRTGSFFPLESDSASNKDNSESESSNDTTVQTSSSSETTAKVAASSGGTAAEASPNPVTSSEDPSEGQMSEQNEHITAPPAPTSGSKHETAQSEADMLPLYADRVAAITSAFYSSCQLAWSSTAVPPRFLDFVRRYLHVLQAIVLRTPTLIFDHFHFLLDHSVFMQDFATIVRAQPFDQRRAWFYEHLHANGAPSASAFSDRVYTVSRDGVFESSCGVLAAASPEHLKETFHVRFEGEEGMGNGVKREWFTVLSHEILNPDYALFVESADGTYQPNPHSHVNPDHLSFFHFAGRAVGLAIYHKQLLDVYFTRSFYKHILKMPNKYTDVESIDPQYAQSLTWILDNDITALNLDLTFSMDISAFGERENVELIPGGASISVTEENKHAYVQLVSEQKMTRGIRAQIAAFLEGFELFVPHSLICIFDEFELELLMSGVPDLCVHDWETNTCYGEDRERALLLQFASGSSRLPIGGFKNLKDTEGHSAFTIAITEDDTDRLPTASTCFNLLKLPNYTSPKQLEERIRTALNGSEGFASA